MRVEADSSNLESYTLDIYPDKIQLVGASERAVFWGLQSLMQLTRKDATWLITKTNDKVVGHVRIENEDAKVVITR